MPLLDIATVQPSFHNQIFTLRAQTLYRNEIVLGGDTRLASRWKSFQIPKKGTNCSVRSIKTRRSAIVIRAVSTLEPKCLVRKSNGGHEGLNNQQLGADSSSTSRIHNQSSSEDSEALDEGEMLRRKRISAANKGKRPWNKGKKHSAETLKRIRERTWLAMQDPKVKMKLAMGHTQSKETRMKIGAGVRIKWEKRRERLMVQETCCFDWQNLIADASRSGCIGEEELQWDSYKILGERLEQEWLETIEQRKNMPRLKASKRAPKSLEQRRKISEAIATKWNDPEYRDRVCSAMYKYHGTAVGAERKPTRRPSGERQPRTPSPAKKKAKGTDSSKRNVTKSQNKQTRPKSKMPLYKDPLASSKLEMIKNIRAQRAAADTKKTEAIEQAKLLIVEAEKAAKSLEAAAMISPLARASLIETRKLIAEAIQSIQSIGIDQIDSNENDQHPSVASAELVNFTDQKYANENDRHPSVASAELVKNAEKENNPIIQCLSQTENGKINGAQAVESSESDIKDFGFGKFNFQDLLNGNDEVLPTSSEGCDLLQGKEELYLTDTSDYGWSPSELNSILKQSSFTEQLSVLESNGKNIHDKELLPGGAEVQFEKEETPPSSITVTKKWVRGKLVEVVDVD